MNISNFSLRGKPKTRRSSSFVTELPDDYLMEPSSSIFKVNRKLGLKAKPKYIFIQIIKEIH
jgi:hypothetical protein